MPEFSAEIEIRPYEFVQDCSKREIKDLISVLEEEGFIKINSSIPDHEREQLKSMLDEEWDETVEKLFSLRLRISVEEQTIIEEIVKKYS
jgi:hypothetical protein